MSGLAIAAMKIAERARSACAAAVGPTACRKIPARCSARLGKAVDQADDAAGRMRAFGSERSAAPDRASRSKCRKTGWREREKKGRARKPAEIAADGSGGHRPSPIDQRQRHAAERADDDDHERRQAPDRQAEQSRPARCPKSPGVLTDWSRADYTSAAPRSPTTAALTPRISRLRADALAKAVPERQARRAGSACPGKKNAEQTERRTGQAVRRRLNDDAQIGGEGEKRTRDRLRRAVARKKGIIADPARRDERFAQQRQHDMAATKHQRAGTIESIEQRERGRMRRKALRDRQSRRAKRKTRLSAKSPTRRDTGMANVALPSSAALRGRAIGRARRRARWRRSAPSRRC